MRKSVAVGALACALSGGHCLAAVPSVVPLSTFGGGDGWVAPGERSYLTSSGHFQRGLAYNAATGNLLVVNRSGGLSINILNGTTGGNVGTLSVSGLSSGGAPLLPLNMIAATPDGTIFATNVVDTSDALFHIYRWDSESDPSPNLEFNRDLGNNLRLGDTLDARGDGVVAELVVGMAPGQGATPGFSDGYIVFTAIQGEAFTSGGGRFNTNPPDDGDHRLGISFVEGRSVVGSQGGGVARLSQYPAPGEGGFPTLLASPGLVSGTERPMDYAVIDGIPVLATVDTASSLVRVYDLTNAGAPALLASATTITGPSNVNEFGVGQVRFGEIEGNTATLYALNANNGIQAFVATVPEPGSAGLICAGVSLTIARRRRTR